MPGSINIGVSCRSIENLGQDEAEVRMFVESYILPAVQNEIMSRRQVYMGGIQAAVRAAPAPELEARDCSVSGSINISF